MKMIYLFSVIIMISTACNNAKKNAGSNAEMVSNKVEEVSAKTAVAVAKTIDTIQAQKNEIVESIGEDKKTNIPSKGVKKEATKSVPKPETKEVKEVLESVETKKEASDKVVKDERLPHPEIKQQKEILKEVEKTKPVTKPTARVTTEHGIFDQLLKTYVDGKGNVDYAGLKSQSNVLQEYLDKLSGTSVTKLNRTEKLAFWINAYNAFTIKLILDNYPVNKITDLENGKPWDKKWISISGKTLSLNQIENEIIRPQFKEPRIHFAVNCAAKSCPPLLNQAWTAANLENNFKKQTKKFINNSNYNTISQNKVVLSKIFEWYAADFGELVTFLNEYSETPIESDATIEYAEYNWNLNKK